MKTLIFVIFLLFSVNAANISKTDRDFAPDSFLYQIVEKIREVMKEGDIQAGIPVLDPFRFRNAKFNYTSNVFSLHSNLTSGVFSGLSEFQIRKFEFLPENASLELAIYFQNLNVFAENYAMNGSIMQAVPLEGKGVLQFNLYDLNIRVKFIFKEIDDGKSTVIDRLENPEFSISRIVSNTEIDENIDDIANAMIEELLADYLNRFNKYLALSFSENIVQFLNAVLFKSGNGKKDDSLKK